MPTFTGYTATTAPPAARRSVEATIRRLGYLPDAVARLAESPQTLDGFLTLSGLFETTTLEPLAREVVIMTIAGRNRCHVCVAMHTATLTTLGAEPGLIAALREFRAPADPALAAARRFTLDVLRTAGAVPEEALTAFLAAGFTRRNALEVVLGIGTYTLSTFANRLTGAELDEALAPHAWREPDRSETGNHTG